MAVHGRRHTTMPRTAPLRTRPKITSRIKRPHDIDLMLKRIAAAIKPFKPAAMFELADEGFNSVFQLLLACIISIRTRDEATVPIARRLFAAAQTPAQVAALSVAQIDKLIHPSPFHRGKARTIHDIAKRTMADFHGQLPCDVDVLTTFPGVGPKC